MFGRKKVYSGTEEDPAKIEGRVVKQGDKAMKYLEKQHEKGKTKSLKTVKAEMEAEGRDRFRGKFAKGGKVTFQDEMRSTKGPDDNPGAKKYTHNIPEYGVGGIIGAVKSLFGAGKGAMAAGKTAQGASKMTKAQKFMEGYDKVKGMMPEEGGEQSKPMIAPSTKQRYANAMPSEAPVKAEAMAGTPESNPMMPKKYRAGTGYYRNTESHVGPQVWKNKHWGVRDDMDKFSQFLKFGGMTGKILGGMMKESAANKEQPGEGTADVIDKSGGKQKDC